MTKIFIFILSFLFIATKSATTNVNLVYKPGSADNPLKGFVPFMGIYNFPHSMEFFYISQKQIQTGYTSFDWTIFEGNLNQIAARGHQAIARIYLDYPNNIYGVSDFLSYVPKRSYSDYGNSKSYSPDYENADLRNALKSLISEFGKKYDGDSRIGFIQVGIVGFWGEWHTYPHNDWMASSNALNELISSYSAAFKKTLMVVREPKTGVNLGGNFGFHDDSFLYSTISSAPFTEWYFWNKIKIANQTNIWKTKPIGGEVYPQLQVATWDESKILPGQEFLKCTQTTHASWMINHGAFGSLNSEQQKKAQTAAKQLGYELSIVNAQLTASALAFTTRVTITNNGVAPFYYKWVVEIGVLKSTGEFKTYPTSWDIRKILPGESFSFTFSSVGNMVGSKIFLRVKNPLTNGKTFTFANVEQDKEKIGWVSLGIAS